MVDKIKRWHVGKLVIVWCWGGGFAALLFKNFLNVPVGVSPIFHTAELVISFGLAGLLSITTWIWLGDRPTGNGGSSAVEASD